MKEKTENVIAMAVFQAILIILPLYMENRYYNIVEAKARMLTLVFTVALALIVIECIVTRGRCILSEKLNGLDMAIICAGLIALISCMCSESFSVTFRGMSGWGIGGFLLLSFSAVYMFLSRNVLLTYKSWIPAFVIACIIACLTVAHSASIDAFSLHSGIAAGQYYEYKSTLGNLNAHVGYSCLLAPLGLIIFVNEKNKTRAVIEFVFMFAMLCEIVFACTDGIYLGLGLCAFLAIPHICDNAQRMKRTLLLVASYGTLLLICNSFKCFELSNMKLDGVEALVRSPKVSVMLTVMGFAGFVFLQAKPHVMDNRKLVKACVTVLEAVLAMAVAYYAIDAVRNFSDLWGTGRGMIWRISIENFSEFPFGRKLTGVGPEMQQGILVPELEGRFFTCHSEPVQILVSMGILGLLAWLAVYGFAICNMLRKKIWKSESIMYALPIVAYMGQSLVYSAMATNVGIMCILLACYRNTCYEQENGYKKHLKKKR